MKSLTLLCQSSEQKLKFENFGFAIIKFAVIKTCKALQFSNWTPTTLKISIFQNNAKKKAWDRGIGGAPTPT